MTSEALDGNAVLNKVVEQAVDIAWTADSSRVTQADLVATSFKQTVDAFKNRFVSNSTVEGTCKDAGYISGVAVVRWRAEMSVIEPARPLTLLLAYPPLEPVA